MLLRHKIFHEQQVHFCSRFIPQRWEENPARSFDTEVCDYVLSLLLLSHATCFHMFFPLMFLDAIMMKWGPERPSLDSSRVFSFFAEKPDVRSKSSWDEIADVSVFWLFSFQRTDLHPISHHLIMCLPALARVCEGKKESERKEKKGRQTGSGAKGLFW